MFGCFKSSFSRSYNVTKPAKRHDYNNGKPQGSQVSPQSSSGSIQRPVPAKPPPQIPPKVETTAKPVVSEVHELQEKTETVQTKKRDTSQSVKHNVERREKRAAPVHNGVDTHTVRQTKTRSVLRDDPDVSAAPGKLTNGYVGSDDDDDEEKPQLRNSGSVTIVKSASTPKTRTKVQEHFEDPKPANTSKTRTKVQEHFEDPKPASTSKARIKVQEHFEDPYEIPDDVDDEPEVEEPTSNQDRTDKKEKNVGFTDEDTVIIVPEDDVEPEREGARLQNGGDLQHKLRRGGVMATIKVDTTQEIKNYPKSEDDVLHIKNALSSNEFLQNVLKGDHLDVIVDAMYPREIHEGEVIIEEGELGNHLYVSASGTYDVYIQNKLVNTITGVFGELALLYNAKRMATIKAASDGALWVLPRKVYQQALVRAAIRDQEETLSFLQNVPMINELKPERLQKVANLLKKEFHRTNAEIVRQGDRGDKFYIIRAGSVTVTRAGEGKVAELSRGEFFGERALLHDIERQATVTADPPGVECLTLTRVEFNEHFDARVLTKAGEVELEEEEERKRARDRERGAVDVPESNRKYADIELKDLQRIETLGVGGFGRVELVQHKTKRELTFALKYLKKVDMVHQGQVEHVFNEKNIQISCESVFIVRMYKTFKDQKYLYFLMESCLGGDLWTYLQKQKGRRVSEKAAQFFAACILEAISYLHDRDRVYRDLKPENMLLDVNGYVKLTDFGFAKDIGPRGKTFTFAGTPEYVAPEIVYNRGHDKAVDYWAFGIFVYELLVGKTPFRTDDPSHMKTYNRILRGINSVHFPPHLSKNAVNLVQKLCKAIPTDRLGAQRNGIQDIRNHKWFQGLDWNKLKNQKLKAPYVPKLNNNVDTKHFEKFRKDDDVPPDEVSGFDSAF